MRGISSTTATILMVFIGIGMGIGFYVFISGQLGKILNLATRKTEIVINDVSSLRVTPLGLYDNKKGLILDLKFDNGYYNITYDYSGDNNNGILKGKFGVIGDFENSLDNFTLDCGGVTKYKFVEGYNGKALEIYPTGGDYLACAHKKLGNIKAGDIIWFYAKGENIWAQIWCGYTNSKLYMYDNGTWKEVKYHTSNQWHLYMLVAEKDDSSGNCGVWIYSLGQGHYGIFDFITSTPVWIKGKLNKALTFDGKDDYVEVSHLYTPHITVMAWVKIDKYPSEVGDSDNWGIISTGCQGAMGGWDLGIHPLGHPYFYITYGSDYYNDRIAVALPPLSKGEWHLVAGSYDGNLLKIFSDGQFSKLEISGQLQNNRVNIYIGRLAYNPNDFTNGDWTWLNGTVDEVRIYNRSLSDDEIKDFFYRLFIYVYNPSDSIIKINGTYISIDYCSFQLIYNKTYITSPKDVIDLRPHKAITLKVAISKCYISKGKHKICLISNSGESCGTLYLS